MCTNALQAGFSLYRGPVGEPGVDSLTGTFATEKDNISRFLGSFFVSR
jgi:hypothetical protein